MDSAKLHVWTPFHSLVQKIITPTLLPYMAGNSACDWLNVLTSFVPNLGAIGSNAIFCEGGDLTGPQAPISATPDSVDHNILGYKLQACGITGSLLEW